MKRGHVAEHPDGTGTVGGIPIDDSTTYPIDKTWGIFQVRSMQATVHPLAYQTLSVSMTPHN